MLKLEKATASQIEKTDWGKRTKQVGLEKQTDQAKTEKPQSPVITLLESLPSDEFKGVKEVDTEV